MKVSVIATAALASSAFALPSDIQAREAEVVERQLGGIGNLLGGLLNGLGLTKLPILNTLLGTQSTANLLDANTINQVVVVTGKLTNNGGSGSITGIGNILSGTIPISTNANGLGLLTNLVSGTLSTATGTGTGTGTGTPLGNITSIVGQITPIAKNLLTSLTNLLNGTPAGGPVDPTQLTLLGNQVQQIQQLLGNIGTLLQPLTGSQVGLGLYVVLFSLSSTISLINIAVSLLTTYLGTLANPPANTSPLANLVNSLNGVAQTLGDIILAVLGKNTTC